MKNAYRILADLVLAASGVMLGRHYPLGAVLLMMVVWIGVRFFESDAE